MTRKDPYRYRCPRRHASWHRRPGDKTPGNYWCESCDEFFESLFDMKRGESKPGVTQ